MYLAIAVILVGLYVTEVFAHVSLDYVFEHDMDTSTNLVVLCIICTIGYCAPFVLAYNILLNTP